MTDNPVKTGALKKLKILSWNLEGLKKNLFNLKYFTDMYEPDLAFISEPQIFQCDLGIHMEYFHGEFCSFLNSEDLHEPELPLRSNRTKGGTLVLWRKELEPFITTHTCDTSSFLPIILEIPGYRTSIHIAVYLPTAGQDSQYMEELAKLRNTIDDFNQKYSNPVIFIRGDANSSSKNSFRK